MTNKKYFYAVWRRKQSTATIRLFFWGSWEISIKSENIESISLEKFFCNTKDLVEDSLYPFLILGKDVKKQFDATIHVHWWWMRWQAEAIRLGLSRALVKYFPDRKLQLKPYWLLKRDDREKERKKPWLRKARKSPQWSKR